MSVVLQLILIHLGFLCLACLTELDHFWTLQKYTQFFCLFLWLILTSQKPNSGIIVLLYAVKTTYLFVVAASCSFVVLGNNILKIWIGIISQPLPVSIFVWYYCSFFYLMMLFNFATITDHLLSDLMELIFTMSVWFSFVMQCTPFCSCWSCTPLWSGWSSHISHTPSHMQDIVNMVGWNDSYINASLFVLVLLLFVVDYFSTLPDYIASKSFISFKLSKSAVGDHQASVCTAHVSICWLVTVLVSFMVVSFHVISVSISLLYSQ